MTDGEARNDDCTEELDISVEFQTEVRRFAESLPALTYYEVIGVEVDADEAQIRDAFFERSKRYHPDRYFSKNVGPYRPIITEVYKRVVAAHDVLRDARLREAYDKMVGVSGAATDAAGETAAETATEETPTPASTPRTRRKAPRSSTKGPSLRSRRGLRSPGRMLQGLQSQLDRSRAKARRHFEEALERKKAGDWVSASSRIKLALAFDPRDERFHQELAEVLHRANEVSGKEARRRGEALLQRGDPKGALDYLLEAAQFLPTDAELAVTVAGLLFGNGGDLKLAVEYGERAIALDAESVQLRKLLARLCRSVGNDVEARRHLQRAWELDPMDKEVRAELQAL